MKAYQDTDSLRNSTVEKFDPAMELAVGVAAEVKKRWREGASPDAQAVLAEHPHMLRYRSVVLDLAAEEYRCRQAAGESMSEEEFADRFPGMGKSLCFLLEVRRMIGEDPASGISYEEILWPEPGDDFLGFSLLAELGQGTFGHVFLASEPSLGNRLVALKVAPQGQWEAEILGKLGHPNIVPVHSIQKDRSTGLTAVCMPYLGRATLLDVIERAFDGSARPRKGRIFADLLRELNEGEGTSSHGVFDISLTRGSYIDAVVHLAVQLADALAFTHEQGIYHRDLKPSNILLSNTGHPLILDFNLSSEEISPARKGGTLPYMAPEQLQCLITDRPPSQALDPASSDLFSLGVILYELLSGALPFGLPKKKGDLRGVALDLLARQQRKPRPLAEINPDVDGRLAALIESCLAFEPMNRPSSAANLAHLLRGQQTLYRRANRWSRRHPYAFAGSGTALILGALLCGIWLVLRPPYPVRQYQSGLSSLQSGNPRGAIDSFNKALDANPNDRESLLERGKAYFLQGKYSLALDDFNQAKTLHASGEVYALEGHCFCRLRYFREAIASFEYAMTSDCQSLSLWNNLGYSHMQLAQRAEADECFQKAIALDPRCSPAWLNRIRVAINRVLKEISIAEAATTLDNAIEVGGSTETFYYTAAILESKITQHDPSRIPNVFKHLRKAIALGKDPQQIAKEVGFQHLWNHEEFTKLLQLTPGPPTSSKGEGVMSPF